MRPVRFSEQYDITRTVDDDWFDPLITEDTALYVDPFLIFLDENPYWANGHARLMEFFNLVMKMLADSGFKDASPLFQKAKGLMMFPEPPEFCLGTSVDSIFGAGSGKGLQAGMLKGAAEAINLGLDELKHFEELALFGKEMAADRVSDITCDVLKPEFVEYTQTIAERHGIPLAQVDVKQCGWDAKFAIWKPGVVELPVNPWMSARAGRPVGVILTPKRFLRRLPSVDPAEFWNFAMSTESVQLRAEFNYELGQHVDADAIARLARRHRALLSAYLDKLADNPKPAYDVVSDPDLIVRSSDFAKSVANALAVEIPDSENDFKSFVVKLVENFKFCVEQRGAWELLWANDKPRQERHVQLLFQATAVQSCRDHDVDISPESNAGRGPVDFKISRGWSLRALLELKLAKSSSFKKNLANQPTTYAGAEGCDIAWFIVVQFTEADFEPTFVKLAEETAKKVGDARGVDFRVLWVDATPKLSASKVG